MTPFRPFMAALGLLAAWGLMSSAPAGAQVAGALRPSASARDSAGHFIRLADSAFAALDASTSYRSLEAALAVDSIGYEARWKAARSAVSLGMLAEDAERADFYYVEAEGHARAAVELQPDGARGLEWLAVALGRRALNQGPRARVRFAEEIYHIAERALAADPESAAAHHVMGMWHAEIRRLSGFSRFIARNLLGGGFFDLATWEQAVAGLERAATLEPEALVHGVDLAGIYVDLDRHGEAHAELTRILALPDREPTDRLHRQAALQLLGEVEDPDGPS